MSDLPPVAMSGPDPAASRTPVPDSGPVAPPAFGRYRLRRKLGTGSYGEVWRADDLFLGEAVALKLLNESFLGEAAALEDLKSEVRTLRRLSHPNIVRVHDLVFDQRHSAIVMEFIDGRTLAELLAKCAEGCLQPTDIEVWLPQLASVFDYLHRSEAIIHSDIKPANLMLTATGRLKVADFGLAVTLAASSSHAGKSRARAGTIAYMSPQQMRGARPSISDDIYSLGATLFHLLTGTTPYHGNALDLIEPNTRVPTIGARRHEIGKGKLPPVPEHWESAIAASLAKDPRLRPASVRDLVRWLKSDAPGASPHKLETSVILPPAGVSAKSKNEPPGPGWQPIAPAPPPPVEAAPARSSSPAPSGSPPNRAVSRVARDSTPIWIGLLLVGLIALGVLIYVAYRYL